MTTLESIDDTPTIVNVLGSLPSTLPDDVLVVRGGAAHTPEILAVAGEVDRDGVLTQLSVNSAPGVDLNELASYLPHNKVAATTVGRVRALGGEVRPTPTWNNPHHADLSGITAEQASGITAEQASGLFGALRENPTPMSARMPLGR